jgi:PST family polysaccharide transporter
MGVCWRPLLACVPMVLAVLAVRQGLAMTGLHVRGLALGAEILAGALAFVPSAFLIAPGPARQLIALGMRVLGRGRPADEPSLREVS